MRLIVIIFAFFLSDTGYPQDLVSVANTFLNDRNYIEAKQAIDEALADQSFQENPRAWYTKGRVYHEILKSQDADLNQFKSNTTDFVGLIVAAYNKTKALTTAGSNLYTLSNNQLELLWVDGINKGVSYYQKRNYNEAIDAFTIAKVVKPQDTTAYIYVGYSAQNARKYDLALSSFAQVKALIPLSKAVHNSIIICTQAKGSTIEEQLEVIETALVDYPDHIPYVLQEIIALVNIGKFTEAESRLQTVLQRNPNSFELKLRQADLYDRIFKQAFVEGKPDRSDRYFELASAIYEEYIETYTNDFTANYNYAVMVNEKANRFYVRGNLMSKEEYEIDGEAVQEQGHELTRTALPYMERAQMLKPNDEKVKSALRVFYKRLKMQEKLDSLDN